jgi:hypothetical protein
MTPASSASQDWQQVHILHEEVNGNQVYVVLLHSLEWIKRNGGLVGERVCLRLPEHGVEGEGQVTHIERSPVISDAEGRVMTFVRCHRKSNEKVATKPGPTSPASQFGLRTYFGERLPPTGHEWVRVAFRYGGGLTADLILTRSKEWMKANYDAVKTLQANKSVPATIEAYRLVRVCVDLEDRKRVHIAFFWPA